MPKHLPIHNNYTICEIDTENGRNCVIVADDIISQLSGEEDPWVSHFIYSYSTLFIVPLLYTLVTF